MHFGIDLINVGMQIEGNVFTQTYSAMVVRRGTMVAI